MGGDAWRWHQGSNVRWRSPAGLLRRAHGSNDAGPGGAGGTWQLVWPGRAPPLALGTGAPLSPSVALAPLALSSRFSSLQGRQSGKGKGGGGSRVAMGRLVAAAGTRP